MIRLKKVVTLKMITTEKKRKSLWSSSTVQRVLMRSEQFARSKQEDR